MEIDTDFETKLEKYFEEYFAHSLRDLRGTEVEILTMKAAAHRWFFSGANEARRIFTKMMIDQSRRWADEIDPLKVR